MTEVERGVTQKRNDAKTQRDHFQFFPLRPGALASLRSRFLEAAHD